MGWSNYLINDKKKIAIEFSRHINLEDFYEEELESFNEFIEYIKVNDGELSLDVIKYLSEKFSISNSNEIFLLQLKTYGFNRVTVDEIPEGYILLDSNF